MLVAHNRWFNDFPTRKHWTARQWTTTATCKFFGLFSNSILFTGHTQNVVPSSSCSTIFYSSVLRRRGIKFTGKCCSTVKGYFRTLLAVTAENILVFFCLLPTLCSSRIDWVSRTVCRFLSDTLNCSWQIANQLYAPFYAFAPKQEW